MDNFHEMFVAYAMAIVLTSPYVLGYQFPYGSQPQFENKCQLINMRSLHLATRMDDTFTNSVNRIRDLYVLTSTVITGYRVITETTRKSEL